MIKKYQKIKKSSLDLQSEKNNKFLNLYLSFFQLKNTLRTGWIKYHGMEEKYTESVADHSYSATILGYSIAKELELDLDYEKFLKLMLFHEIGEIYAGDIVSFKNREITVEEKDQMEREGIAKVFENSKIENEMKEMWEEFTAGKTMEAKFAKSIDQLEAVFQAWVYQKNNLVGESVGEFLEYAKKISKENEQKEVLEILESISL